MGIFLKLQIVCSLKFATELLRRKCCFIGNRYFRITVIKNHKKYAKNSYSANRDEIFQESIKIYLASTINIKHSLPIYRNWLLQFIPIRIISSQIWHRNISTPLQVIYLPIPCHKTIGVISFSLITVHKIPRKFKKVTILLILND